MIQAKVVTVEEISSCQNLDIFLKVEQQSLLQIECGVLKKERRVESKIILRFTAPSLRWDYY